MEPHRLPRFQRSPTASAFHLTDRDRHILQLVYEHRFLSSVHLGLLLPGSRQQLLRRLQLLFHHGYLERPPAQITYYERGSRPMVYGLGPKGSALLKRDLGLAFHELDWGRNQSNLTRLFLDHALKVSEVLVALQVACRQHPHIRLTLARDIPLPEPTRGRRQPFRWTVETRNHALLTVIPDAAFLLEFPQHPAGPQRILYFLEADCGTMPVRRATLTKSSFHRKLLAYEATLYRGLTRQRFNLERFRVLTVTTTPARVQSLVESCSDLRSGKGLFLFTDQKSLSDAPDILSLPWFPGHGGEPESLLGGGSEITHI